MSKCGKGCMPECEYFMTGGCISPFNCMYKEESGYSNSATSGKVFYTGGVVMSNAPIDDPASIYEVANALQAEVRKLKSENAALRERLDKAVELPCKVGDKVYIPWAWDNQSGIVEAPVVTIRLYPYTRKYETRLETNSLTFAQKYQYGNFNDKDFGTLIFTTREAAEARLKEL